MYKLFNIKRSSIVLAVLTSVCNLLDHVTCDDFSIKMKAEHLVNVQWQDNCDLYEPVHLPTFFVELELWCAIQCSDKDYCYYATVSGGRCLFCVTSISDDNSWQSSSVTFPADTEVYYKTERDWRKTYEIVEVAVTQAAAHAACRSEGKQLLSLASVDEFQTVKSMIQGYGLDFWLGLTRQGDGTWQFDDGSSDLSGIWHPGEPNGDGSCAHFFTAFQLSLNDQTCGGSKYYICELYVYA